MIRQTAVAGQFYPSNKEEIEMMFEHFNKVLESHIKDPKMLTTKTRAVIVPHAGYVYSGFTANVAHRLLGNVDLDTVVVIGPSHRVYLSGSSVGAFEAYETPLGDLQGDMDLSQQIIERFGMSFVPGAHAEHSTEVQFPFIKHYLPQTRIVEIVYGDEDPVRLAESIAWLLEKEHIGVVISTDLSHYYDLKTAKGLDRICLNAVSSLDPARLHAGCEACGKIGIEGMLIAAKEVGLEPLILDYRTSADASGDTSEVVGYMSAAFI